MPRLFNNDIQGMYVTANLFLSTVPDAMPFPYKYSGNVRNDGKKNKK